MNLSVKVATFAVGQHILGVDVQAISQVLDYPQVVVDSPLTDTPIKAMFGWRGMMLPLIDVPSALGMKARPLGSPLRRKVVVVTDGSVTAGFVMEATLDVVAVDDDRLNRWESGAARGNALVYAVATLDEGKRVIEMLDTIALLGLAGLPKGATTNITGGAVSTVRNSGEKHLTFQAAGVEYALNVSLIVEVITLTQIIETLLVSMKCIGMVAYRGRRLPIVPFAAVLGGALGSHALDPASRVLVIRYGRDMIGLLVDAAQGIESFAPRDVLAMVTEVGDDKRWFRGMVRGLHDVERLIVEPEYVRSNPELAGIANGYGTIYGRGPEGVGGEAARYRRRYYLLFKLRELLAVEMNELREIITLPPDILRPPGVPSYIVGIHSLRGEVVTLLDARQVYGMPARSPEGDTARSKVLIFRHKDLKLGVIIDSVESIVAADFQSLIPIPRSLMGSLSADFDTDVKDFIEVADFTTRRTLKFIVLEFTRVFDRLQVA